MSSNTEIPAAPLFQWAHQPAFRAFAIRSLKTAGKRRAVTERVLRRTPFYALRRFDAAGHDRDAAPVLVVPPLSGHFPIILRDMVLSLLADRPVAVLDWCNVRHVAVGYGRFGFDSNIRAIADAILQIGPPVRVVALCQGGVPALAATADLAAHLPESEPAALVLIAAPVDPMANPTPVVETIRERPLLWYRTVPISHVGRPHAGHRRMVYSAETQLAALQQYLSAAQDAESELARKMRVDDGADPRHFPFRDLYTSVMDLDARHYAENIDRVFLSRQIARGTLHFEGRCIQPNAIHRTALLTIEGASDAVAAPGQTSTAHALCPEVPDRNRHSLIVPDCGHFALFHGATWRDTVYPAISAHITG